MKILYINGKNADKFDKYNKKHPVFAKYFSPSCPACIAMELALTGERITAQRAYEIGLVNKVVPDEELMPEALKVAERIAELPPLAMRKNKIIAQKAMEVSRELWDLRYQTELELLNSEDYHEAATAFIEKRKPIFKGK